VRISVIESDPGYSPGVALYGRVYLDGVEQFAALTADDVAGEVLRMKVSPAGVGRLEIDDNGEVVTELVKGRVTIVLPENMQGGQKKTIPPSPSRGA
jgi:hypothetical protein